ncbi:mechanosensitive ion channel family protein [Ekhidna sp.]|uniref:mechanosensitive ion channel family protein n=1 Tax=Ekhidna sp. TaxID=2608089 RepID=UPI00329A06D6
MTLQEILDFELFSISQYSVKASSIFFLILVYMVTRIFLWILKKSLLRGKLFKRLDKGQAMAYYQIAKYVVIVIAISIALEGLGIKITFLLAGSAALLVGVGLGLQQLFNDLVSGFIILTEHSIKVEDIIEVDGIVARVKEIGLRTSKVETRNDIMMILPNSKIVNENVTNWSHNKKVTRFSLFVGVAYGSNVDLVAELLKEAADENPDVVPSHQTVVRFIDFGDSSLQFEVLFWSNNQFRIEDVKSKIRFAINRKFIENKVQIPFPQRDLHLKSAAVAIPIEQA